MVLTFPLCRMFFRSFSILLALCTAAVLVFSGRSDRMCSPNDLTTKQQSTIVYRQLRSASPDEKPGPLTSTYQSSEDWRNHQEKEYIYIVYIIILTTILLNIKCPRNMVAYGCLELRWNLELSRELEISLGSVKLKFMGMRGPLSGRLLVRRKP